MSGVPKLAVVLAAGRGSRLGPLTDSVPKPLIRVGCVPILHRLLCALDWAGVERVVLVVGYRAGQIVSAVGPSWRGLDVSYVVNPEWGTANNILSLLRAAPEIREDFLLA
jgi:glucose-1-phosphate thymidylyltransferase